jgi:acetyl/propionyl-CoA carboxylase alpha subunit
MSYSPPDLPFLLNTFQVNYVGAGTVEFIFDNDTQEFFFMEMYAKLSFTGTITLFHELTGLG